MHFVRIFKVLTDFEEQQKDKTIVDQKQNKETNASEETVTSTVKPNETCCKEEVIPANGSVGEAVSTNDQINSIDEESASKGPNPKDQILGITTKM